MLQATVGRARRLCPGPWTSRAVRDGAQLGGRARHPDQPICLKFNHQDVTLLIPQAGQSRIWAGLLPGPGNQETAAQGGGPSRLG